MSKSDMCATFVMCADPITTTKKHTSTAWTYYGDMRGADIAWSECLQGFDDVVGEGLIRNSLRHMRKNICTCSESDMCMIIS